MINHKIYIGQTILDDVIKDRYRSFKQPAVQNKIFNNNLYKEEYGFIFKKILKTDSEKRKIRKDIKQKILTC